MVVEELLPGSVSYSSLFFLLGPVDQIRGLLVDPGPFPCSKSYHIFKKSREGVLIHLRAQETPLALVKWNGRFPKASSTL